jgi:hypothetical protein
LQAGPLPAVPLPVAPERGTVTVRRATLKATNVKECLAAELPAFVAFYQPNADSTADDRFEQEVSFAAGRKQIHVSTLRHADLIVAIGPRNGMARSPKPRRQSRRQNR